MFFDGLGNPDSEGMSEVEVEKLLYSQKVDPFEAHKYKHGEPFFVGEYFEGCSSSCRKLHQYCMDIMSKGEDHNIVELHYDRRHFFHNAGTINVEFEDFHLFFNFNKLAITLVKCLML